MIAQNEIDVYAAEYVIGTLDYAERNEVTTSRSANTELDTAVTAWEIRLSPLNSLTPQISPSPKLLNRIETVIFNPAPASATRPASVKPKQARFALLMALLLTIGFMLGFVFLGQNSAPQLVATLLSKSNSPMFTVALAEKTAILNVHRQADAPTADKSFQLWIIPEGATKPRSLGILSSPDSALQLPPDVPVSVLENATLAVSLEPLGGSPTDGPTGPVVVTGKFKQAQL